MTLAIPAVVRSSASLWPAIPERVARRSREAKVLYWVSILYFAIPCLIFLVGFTRWYIALVAGAALVAAVVFDLRAESRFLSDRRWARATKFVIPAVVIIAFGWTVLFGTGFIGPLSGDQSKNMLIFADLVRLPWPVRFDSMPSTMSFLSYPLGYYLVPAAIAKVIGWALGSYVIYIWSALGVALVFGWLYVLFGRFVAVAIPAFILFSGLDIVGEMLENNDVPVAGTHLEWWSGWTFLEYSSNATIMTWSTQHSAAQWLLPALLIYRIIGRSTGRGSVLLVGVGLFWSHLTIIGALVFVPLLIANRRKLVEAIKDPAMLVLPFVLVIVLDYASKAPGAIESGFLWNLWPLQIALPRIALFLILEVGVLAALIFVIRPPRRGPERLLFISAVVVLALIPIYRAGWSNDVSLRVSGIPLFVLFLFMVDAMIVAWRDRRRAAGVAISLYVVLAAFTPANEMYRQITQMVPQPSFTTGVTSGQWTNGVDKNCFYIVAPRDYKVRVGDTVRMYGNGDFEVRTATIKDGMLTVCGPDDLTIATYAYRLQMQVQFFRDGKELHEGFHLRFFQTLDELPSITVVWPEQYTGSDDSVFAKYIMRP